MIVASGGAGHGTGATGARLARGEWRRDGGAAGTRRVAARATARGEWRREWQAVDADIAKTRKT
jgi:hypothetical protein